jgi:hypothetical protein
VNFFLAKAVGGAAALGADPEFDAGGQTLRELKFFSREEVGALPRVYPRMLRDEAWAVVAAGGPVGGVFRLRGDCFRKGRRLWTKS